MTRRPLVQSLIMQMSLSLSSSPVRLTLFGSQWKLWKAVHTYALERSGRDRKEEEEEVQITRQSESGKEKEGKERKGNIIMPYTYVTSDSSSS